MSFMHANMYAGFLDTSAAGMVPALLTTAFNPYSVHTFVPDCQNGSMKNVASGSPKAHAKDFAITHALNELVKDPEMTF